MLPPPRPMETAMARAMAMMAHTDDSRPRAMPARVGWPGRSGPPRRSPCTGPRSVEVKCSVIWLATSIRTTPVSTA